jgi:F5/8 type C domain
LKPHNTSLPLPTATAPSLLLSTTASTASGPAAEPTAAQTSTHAAGTPVTTAPTKAVPSSAATSAVAALAAPNKPKPTTAPGTDLATRRPVVDSGHNDVYVASNAVDGNPNTYWESTNNAFPQSITVDLGASVGVGRIVVTLPPLPSWVFRTQTISVLSSLDGASFTTIVGAAGCQFNPLAGNTATIPLRATQARYVRLTFTANTAWPAGQASEIEIFAP